MPLLALTPFPLALAFAPLLRRLARTIGLVDRPRSDRFHAQPTPKIGGVAIALALCPLAVHLAIDAPVVRAAATGMLGAFLLGLADDRVSLPPLVKLVGQCVPGVVSIALLLEEVSPAGPLATIPPAGLLVVGTFWVVALQNALNLLDNMDGVAGGVSVIALSAFAFLLPPGPVAWLSLGLALAFAGFLPQNLRRPARIFLGDSGALLGGHALGFFSFHAAIAAADPGAALAPLLVVGVPLLDTAFVTVTRLRAGRSPAAGGRDHTTHRLFGKIGSVPKTRAVFWAVGLAASLVAISIRRLDGPATLVALALALGGALALGFVLASLPVPEHGGAGARGPASR